MTAPLPLAAAEKLAKVLELIDSPVDGEALAAARMAGKLVKAAGLRWRDVLLQPAPVAPAAAAPPPRPTWAEPATWRQAVVQCLRFDTVLTAWEQDFLASIAALPGLSEKQSNILWTLASCGRWSPRCGRRPAPRRRNRRHHREHHPGRRRRPDPDRPAHGDRRTAPRRAAADGQAPL